MRDQLVLAIDLLRRVGLCALLVMAHSELMRRLDGHEGLKPIVTGLAFGFGAITATFNPISVPFGVSIDARNVLLGLAGPFGGWPAALIASGMLGAYCISLGGPGLPASLIAIVVAAGAGLAFTYWHKRPAELLSTSSLALLGAATSLCAFSTLAFPADMRWAVFVRATGPIAVATTLGTLILGTLLVRERRRMLAEAASRKSALVDFLTGLPNRRAFHDHLGRALVQSERDGTQLALLMLDVDRFKSLNDKYGHEIGDQALVALSTALKGLLRQTDFPARLGGDEFSVVLPCTSADEAQHVARRIQDTVEAVLLQVAGAEATFSVSVGVASFVPGMSAGQLLRGADVMLYAAKHERGSRQPARTDYLQVA